jgi:hypothetical protein
MNIIWKEINDRMRDDSEMYISYQKALKGTLGSIPLLSNINNPSPLQPPKLPPPPPTILGPQPLPPFARIPPHIPNQLILHPHPLHLPALSLNKPINLPQK